MLSSGYKYIVIDILTFAGGLQQSLPIKHKTITATNQIKAARHYSC